jgi:hypothetical protein
VCSGVIYCGDFWVLYYVENKKKRDVTNEPLSAPFGKQFLLS